MTILIFLILVIIPQWSVCIRWTPYTVNVCNHTCQFFSINLKIQKFKTMLQPIPIPLRIKYMQFIINGISLQHQVLAIYSSSSALLMFPLPTGTLLLLSYIKLIPASGPLHLLFFLPRIFSSRYLHDLLPHIIYISVQMHFLMEGLGEVFLG